jgi:hypothetical protein
MVKPNNHKYFMLYTLIPLGIRRGKKWAIVQTDVSSERQKIP